MIIRSIRDIIRGRALNGIGPDATAQQACLVLKQTDVGALAVLDENRLIGILSERDIIRKALANGLRADETLVRQIMTADPVSVAAETTLADAMEKMIKGKFRHLPVFDAGVVIGILSMRDIPTEYRLMFERFNEYRQDAPRVA